MQKSLVDVHMRVFHTAIHSAERHKCLVFGIARSTEFLHREFDIQVDKSTRRRIRFRTADTNRLHIDREHIEPDSWAGTHTEHLCTEIDRQAARKPDDTEHRRQDRHIASDTADGKPMQGMGK